jgi:hypothetical protein
MQQEVVTQKPGDLRDSVRDERRDGRDHYRPGVSGTIRIVK